MDEIIFNETKKVSAAREPPGFLGYDYDDNDLYRVGKWVLKRLKKNLMA